MKIVRESITPEGDVINKDGLKLKRGPSSSDWNMNQRRKIKRLKDKGQIDKSIERSNAAFKSMKDIDNKKYIPTKTKQPHKIGKSKEGITPISIFKRGQDPYEKLKLGKPDEYFEIRDAVLELSENWEDVLIYEDDDNEIYMGYKIRNVIYYLRSVYADNVYGKYEVFVSQYKNNYKDTMFADGDRFDDIEDAKAWLKRWEEHYSTYIDEKPEKPEEPEKLDQYIF